MNRKATVIFSIAAVMILLTGGFLTFIRSHQRLTQPGVKLVKQPSIGEHGQPVGTNSAFLPERVSNFTSQNLPILDQVINVLPKDTTYGSRLYEENGLQVQLNVVLMGVDRTSMHRPEWCLPAQGWVVQKDELDTLSITKPYPYSLRVRKLTGRKEGKLADGTTVRQSAVYVYWFVTENQLAVGHEEFMWSIIRHLVQKAELQRWAYVSCFAHCDVGDEEKTYERVKGLLAAAVPEFQLVAGPREPGKEVASMEKKEASE
jgi:hypothetical protein